MTCHHHRRRTTFDGLRTAASFSCRSAATRQTTTRQTTTRPGWALDTAGATALTTSALAAGLVLALGAVAVGVGAGPATAAWRGTSSSSAPVAVASLTSSLQLVSGGTLDAGGTVYRVGGVTNGTAGYVNVVNTSSTAATVSLTYQMASLLAGNTVRACSQPWTVPAGGSGTCTGTTTSIAGDALTSANGTYTTPVPLPASGRLYLRLEAAGVATQTTVTLGAPHYRPGQNRTAG